MCELTGQLAACKVCTEENKRLRDLAEMLAEALRWHEDRRANPTSRGGPALAGYDAHIDGSPQGEEVP